ncbi:MAG: hypothetical protein HZR80_03810 [Candidatus Heimdallarchaeota archaeon]
MLNRIIWKLNPNYRAGMNSYFSMNDEGQMRLLVPYSISNSWRIEKTSNLAMMTYLERLGGVLEFDSEGNLIKDYTELTTLPDYARIQCYSEDWLEYNINKWGRHRKGDHEFAYWFTTTEQLGISSYDDVRVIYDANTGETSQYVMLTQPESESELLRGAIKANATGIYFFDWADLTQKPKDTLNAINHCGSALDKLLTTAHKYIPILPLLFPIMDAYGSMRDYAYIVPIQYERQSFGGIAITNPYDPTNTYTWVELAETYDTVDSVLERAIENYLVMLGEEDPTIVDYTETLVINEVTSFEKDGNTIFVANGNLTYIPDNETDPISENNTVWFTQDFLNLTQWQQVIFLEPGDVVLLDVVYINELFYCKVIYSVN